MIDRLSCCDDIVDTKGRVKSLEEWRDEYILSAQRWRDDHSRANREDQDKISLQLTRIENKLTTFVNPVLAIVISLLTAAVGVLSGALYALAR